MNVSIIIVNYNTRQITQACINSIFEQTINVSFEVILVDNASTDGSKELFEKDERIVYIYSDKNLGFGRANNLGLEYANGKYIFLLNSDTILLNNAVGLFFNEMEKSPDDVSCMGCELMDINYKKIHSYGVFPSFSVSIIRRLCHLIPWGNYYKTYGFDYRIKDSSDIYRVDYITGADLFIRNTVIIKYGLFDPDFFMYYEDAELQKRYNVNGYYSFVIKSPKIIHLVNKSSDTSKENVLNNKTRYSKGLFLYIKKTTNSYSYYLFRVIYYLLSIPILFYMKYPLKQRLVFLKAMRATV